MYKNRTKDGRNNICGKKIKIIRQTLPKKTSQKKLAEIIQLEEIDIDKNAIQRIESGERFVTDIELKAIANALNVTCDELVTE